MSTEASELIFHYTVDMAGEVSPTTVPAEIKKALESGRYRLLDIMHTSYGNGVATLITVILMTVSNGTVNRYVRITQ